MSGAAQESFLSRTLPIQIVQELGKRALEVPLETGSEVTVTTVELTNVPGPERQVKRLDAVLEGYRSDRDAASPYTVGRDRRLIMTLASCMIANEVAYGRKSQENPLIEKRGAGLEELLVMRPLVFDAIPEADRERAMTFFDGTILGMIDKIPVRT